MMRHVFPPLAALIAVLPLSATPVELSLAPGGGFDVTFALSTGQTTQGRDNLSGSIHSDVVLNPDDEVERFRMNGGRIAHSDETLDLLIGPTVYGTARARLITAGVATLPVTQSGIGWVDAFSGLVDNTGHRMISNEGTSTTRILLNGSQAAQEVRDFAVNNDNIALTGTTTLTAASAASGGWWKRMTIHLDHQRDTTRVYPVAANPLLAPGTTYSLRELGSFTAIGEAVFPGPDFITWAQDYRYVTPSDLTELDPVVGQPLLILYALGALDGAWSLPVVFEPALSRAVVSLPSPTRAPVRWEYASDPAAGNWAPVIGGNIPAGTSGNVILTLPASPRGFLRAFVPVP